MSMGGGHFFDISGRGDRSRKITKMQMPTKCKNKNGQIARTVVHRILSNYGFTKKLGKLLFKRKTMKLQYPLSTAFFLDIESSRK